MSYLSNVLLMIVALVFIISKFINTYMYYSPKGFPAGISTKIYHFNRSTYAIFFIRSYKVPACW